MTPSNTEESLVERAARAMCREVEERTSAEIVARHGDEGWKIIGYPTLDAWVDASWMRYAPSVRTLLAAMTEPTRAMLEGACAVGPDTNSGPFSFDDARYVFTAMIQAALSEGEG